MPEDKDLPKAEALQVQSAEQGETIVGSTATPVGISSDVRHPATKKRGGFRPNHKGTFVGLLVVLAIIAINAGVIWFILKKQAPTADDTANRTEVTLSTDTLERLGMNKSNNLQGLELVVGPNARFNGDLKVSQNVNIAGQLNLNGKLTASDAAINTLQASTATVNELNANNDITGTNINARRDVTVGGATRLQGAVTIAQLLTVNNSVNILGNLAVGGTLSARGFQASILVSDSTLSIGGHVITRGEAPAVSAGGGVGQNGTVSISGNDASGTVAVNTGVGATGGIVARVSFKNAYTNIPHVVVTAIGPGAGSVYVNRSAGGFEIGVGGSLAPGGYAFDYIVMQ